MSLVDKVNEKNCYWKLLGIKLLEAKKGYAKMVIPITDKLFQAWGRVHGGVTASLIDSAVAASLICSLSAEETSTTIEMKINYLAPVMSDGKLFAESNIIKHGKTIAVGTVNVTDNKGKLIAIGTATYMIMRKKP